jgi:hypothetical protein
LELRIYDIIRGVEGLETSLAFLEEDLTVEQGEIEQAKEILETTRNVIDDRCTLIAEILQAGGNDEASVDDGDWLLL